MQKGKRIEIIYSGGGDFFEHSNKSNGRTWSFPIWYEPYGRGITKICRDNIKREEIFLSIVISLMGGLGLFLYGMNLMGEGLQKSAGTILKAIIKLLTSNIFMGVLVGTGVTAVIQSSSATTVMVVGFVNAGIMTLKQAIGVIMGANIGTTVTAQLVSFNLNGMAPVALGNLWEYL